jgi:signal transduction histidine kinase
MVERFAARSALLVMVQVTMENALSADAPNVLFEQTAGQQYARDLLFSNVVSLMSSVACGTRQSTHAAYQDMLDQIHVSAASVNNNKLNGPEPKVSAALVRHAGERLQPLITAISQRTYVNQSDVVPQPQDFHEVLSHVLSMTAKRWQRDELRRDKLYDRLVNGDIAPRAQIDGCARDPSDDPKASESSDGNYLAGH